MPKQGFNLLRQLGIFIVVTAIPFMSLYLTFVSAEYVFAGLLKMLGPTVFIGLGLGLLVLYGGILLVGGEIRLIVKMARDFQERLPANLWGEFLWCVALFGSITFPGVLLLKLIEAIAML